MRKRPLLTTTVDPDLYKLLRDEARKDERPLSFMLERALRTWARTLPEKPGNPA